MKLSKAYNDGSWPEKICVKQGSHTTVYVPKRNTAHSKRPDTSTETLKLSKSEAWPNELFVINNNQTIKKYQPDFTENERLRELTEDMLNYIEIRATLGRPPTSEAYETFAQRAAELGVKE